MIPETLLSLFPHVELCPLPIKEDVVLSHLKPQLVHNPAELEDFSTQGTYFYFLLSVLLAGVKCVL